ncbi:murein hydrolase activator EnvC family protein [Gordonia lacunae]|uniref:murein hydrolase activator EnvC family protein n=1 Tax=Gordonia lacunae TaxID=417102 RepID=UPI0039E6910D
MSPAPVDASEGSYSAPLSPRPTVVTGYDEPAQRWQPGHRGVDLAAGPGQAVRAAGAGRVRFAGTVAGRPLVSVSHPDGVITTYEPVEASVAAGDHVSRGEIIGTVISGHPGCPVVVCLHWGARRGSGRGADYLDPLGLLGAVRVRLKPVG